MTSTTTPASTAPPRAQRGIRGLAAAHPIAAFSTMAFGVGWPLLALGGSPVMASLAVLGAALAVAWAGGGRKAVLRFLARYLIWRVGAARWALVVLALPALTVAVAAASGTLHVAGHGWAYVAGGFLLQTFVTGALEVNLAEEGGWSGLVQTRLAARHGLFVGALLTAPLFVAIHLPLQFTHGWTWGSVAVGVAVLAVLAPFFRYVIGETLEATGGSLLCVGVLHASFNASGRLGFPGGWQFLPALLLLAITLGLVRLVRTRRGAAT